MARSKMLKVSAPEDNIEYKIALYARVSTDAQAEEGYSIDIQKERLAAYAKTISSTDNVQYYIDDGYSGGNLNRPDMIRLIDDIKNNNITHVIVYKLDRLSRSQKDTLYLIEDVFIPHNVAFISVQESFNTASPFGRAVIGILSVFAQFERENIYERTRSGMKKRVESGYWMGGGIVPFGYDYSKEKGILVQNKDADTVRQIYDLYLKGYSEETIAKKFKLKYDRLVHQILTRKSNTGVIVYNGEEFKGLHEPIISPEIYNKTMRLMRQRSEKKLVAKTHHLLTGLFECGECGAKMRYQPWGNGKYKIKCYSQQSSKQYLIKDPDCDNIAFDADKIEQVIIADIFSMTSQLKNDKNNNFFDNKSVIETLENKLRFSENKIKKLYSLYAEDDNDYLLESINKIKEEIKSLKEEINKEKEEESKFKDTVKTKENLKDLENVWEFMTPVERREAVRSVVDKIILKKDSIEIKYKI